MPKSILAYLRLLSQKSQISGFLRNIQNDKHTAETETRKAPYFVDDVSSSLLLQYGHWELATDSQSLGIYNSL